GAELVEALGVVTHILPLAAHRLQQLAHVGLQGADRPRNVVDALVEVGQLLPETCLLDLARLGRLGDLMAVLLERETMLRQSRLGGVDLLFLAELAAQQLAGDLPQLVDLCLQPLDLGLFALPPIVLADTVGQISARAHGPPPYPATTWQAPPTSLRHFRSSTPRCTVPARR